MTPEEFVAAWPLSRLAIHHAESGWQVSAFAFHNEANSLPEALTLLQAQLHARTVAVLPPVPAGWRYIHDKTSASWVPKKATVGNLPPPFSVVRDWLEATPFLYIPQGPPQAPARASIVFGPWRQQRENDVGLVETLSRINRTTGKLGAVVQRWRHKESNTWVEYSGWVVFLGNSFTDTTPDALGHCPWADDMATVDIAALALGVTFQEDPPQPTKATRKKRT